MDSTPNAPTSSSSARSGSGSAGSGLNTIEVEIREQSLYIRPQRTFGSNPGSESEWAQHIIGTRAGPFAAIVIDLVRYPVVSSWFFAGMMSLLEHYSRRHNALSTIQLINADGRVARTIDMMNMGHLFEVSPFEPPA